VRVGSGTSFGLVRDDVWDFVVVFAAESILTSQLIVGIVLEEFNSCRVKGEALPCS